MFRLGQLILIAAGPGTGKSAFTLTLALRSGVTCLYFSADSDPFVQLTRALCIETGCSVAAAERAVLTDDGSQLGQALAGLPIRMVYDASPGRETIETNVEAYEEVYGEYPKLVVVDNFLNVAWEPADDGSADRNGLMNYLHELARATGACVVVLHHVTAKFNDAADPIPLSGIKDQITAIPETAITLFRSGPGSLGVSTPKQRGGKQDPTGQSYVELDFDGDHMRISDPQPRGQRAYNIPTSEPARAEGGDIWAT